MVSFANQVASIEKLEVSMPDSLVQAAGGFSPGIGSSLEFHKKLPDGSLEFYAVTDRGPNSPAFDHGSQCMVSFYPEFSPTIARVVVSPDHTKAEVKDYIQLTYQGKVATGIHQGDTPGSELMCSADLKPLPSQFGLDSESLAIMKNGTFVVGDEYRPSLNLVHPQTGEILKILTPGDGLPNILKQRPMNRGFEAVAVTPDDKIWCMLESTLDDPNLEKKNALFVRLIQVDPLSGQTQMFAYPFDYTEYANSSKVKIGDMVALDNQSFLLVEQGPTKDGGYRNRIYKINVKDATDISGLQSATGQHLEHGVFSDLSKVHFVKKELVLDPRAHGWTADKLEGLARIDDHTLAIMNDNDFGLMNTIELNSVPCKSHDESDCKMAKPMLDKEQSSTLLWIFKMRDQL